MGYETSYGFRKLQGSEEDYEKFKKEVAEELGYEGFVEDEAYYGRWYWEDARPFLEEVSKKYPELLVEVHGEIEEYGHQEWKARFKNGESEEALGRTFFEPFNNGNLHPVPDDAGQLTKQFVRNCVSACVSDLERKAEALLSFCNWTEQIEKFKGKNTFGRILVKAILEDLAYEYGPLEEDAKSRAGKEAAGLIQGELAGLK